MRSQRDKKAVSVADLERARTTLVAAESELEIARKRLSENPLDPDLPAAVATLLERRKAADVTVQIFTERLLENRLRKCTL